jgi:hypothetical protein
MGYDRPRGLDVYRYRKLLLIPAALLLVAAVGVPRLFSKSDERKLPQPASGVAVSCPRLVSEQLPVGMARVASHTRNLGGGVFGESTIYSDGAREVSFHIGYEVIEKLEDLDFSQSETQIGSRRVTLYESRALPPGVMVAAEWETSVGPPKCSLVTVLTKEFSRAEFERVVAGLQVRRPG